jgi:hypothetical protein
VIYLPYAADLLNEAQKVLAATLQEDELPSRYERLMAHNAVGIALREIGELDHVNAAAVTQLASLAGLNQVDASFPASRQAQVEWLIAISQHLKASIRGGMFDGECGAALRDALYLHCFNSLAISNPKAVQA